MKNLFTTSKTYTLNGTLNDLEEEIKSFEQYRWRKYFIDSDKKMDLKYRVSSMISVGTFCGMGICSGILALLKLNSIGENKQHISLSTKFRWEWIFFAISYIVVFFVLSEDSKVEVLLRIRDLILASFWMILAYRFQDYILIRKIEKLLKLSKSEQYSINER